MVSRDVDVGDGQAAGGRPRRAPLVVAGAFGAALLVGGGAWAAYALFTSQATVAGQSVGTATVEISADTASVSEPIDVSDMLPGDEVSTDIVLQNTGTADVYYTVTVRPPEGYTGDPALEDELIVRVAAGGSSWSAYLTDWWSGAYQAGAALEPGASQTVTVGADLPEGVGNAVQGTETQFVVQFDAVQVRNNPNPSPTPTFIRD